MYHMCKIRRLYRYPPKVAGGSSAAMNNNCTYNHSQVRNGMIYIGFTMN